MLSDFCPRLEGAGRQRSGLLSQRLFGLPLLTSGAWGLVGWGGDLAPERGHTLGTLVKADDTWQSTDVSRILKALRKSIKYIVVFVIFNKYINHI